MTYDPCDLVQYSGGRNRDTGVGDFVVDGVNGLLGDDDEDLARGLARLVEDAELRRAIATNVLEAVELARPEWTQQQRADEAKHGDPSSTDPVEKTSVVVYVGDEKVGALETLRDVAIPEVSELRFYDARDARRRWGTEHRYGAIEIVPADAASTSAAAPSAPDATR